MSRIDHLYMPENNMEEVYHSSNPIVSFVHTQRLKKIVEMVPSGKELRILDAGCGEGHLIDILHEKFPQNEYAGIDITDVALEKSKVKCPYAMIRKMDLDQINFPDEYFDVVVCTEVLEHIYEFKDVIHELERVLKKGGMLIVTHPNEVLWTASRFLLRRKPIRVPDHVNAFTQGFMSRTVNLPLTRKMNLPFGFPFAFSLTCLLVFQKK